MVKCDFCGEWRADLYSMVSPILHGKDVLYFCKDTKCRAKFFEQREVQDERKV